MAAGAVGWPRCIAALRPPKNRACHSSRHTAQASHDAAAPLAEISAKRPTCAHSKIARSYCAAQRRRRLCPRCGQHDRRVNHPPPTPAARSSCGPTRRSTPRPSSPHAGAAECGSRSPPAWTGRSAPPARTSLTNQWINIRYPQAVWDEDAGRWISDAQIAETEYTAFAGVRHVVTAISCWSIARQPLPTAVRALAVEARKSRGRWSSRPVLP
jgi:hypothetical protein